jgi:hypothetical protein
VAAAKALRYLMRENKSEIKIRCSKEAVNIDCMFGCTKPVNAMTQPKRTDGNLESVACVGDVAAASDQPRFL